VGSRLRLLVAALATVAAAAVVAACGGDSGSSNKVTITFLTGQQESTRLEAQAKADIDRFNETHPNIEVKRDSMDNDQLRTVLKTRLNSNNGPDVFSYDTGPGFGGVLAKAGLLEPLDKAYTSTTGRSTTGRASARPTAARPTASPTRSRRSGSSTTRTSSRSGASSRRRRSRSSSRSPTGPSRRTSSRWRSPTRISGLPATSSR